MATTDAAPGGGETTLNHHNPMRDAVRGMAPAGMALLLAAGGCSDSSSGPDLSGDDLGNLPPDTGGVHLALPRDPNDADAPPFGSYLYLPAGLAESRAEYPLLVFLHGSGERGDSAQDPAALDLVLHNGPPRLIARGEWAPPHPLIVISPQCHTGWWNPADVRQVLEWVDQHYPVNRSRIYLTGLSMGGYGTWTYLGSYGGVTGDSIAVAAAVPICGAGNPGQAAAMAGTPIWAFHGTADGTVAPSGSVTMIKAVGGLSPAEPPRLTLYDGVGHDSWSRTYNGDGVGQGLSQYAEAPDVTPWLVAYDPDIWSWLLAHRR